MSLRVKLTLWYGLLVVVVLTLLAAIRYAGQRQLLFNQTDYALRVVADILDSALPRRTPTKATVQKVVARLVKDYPDIELKGTVIEVYDPSRKLIYSSSLSEQERLPLTDEMWSVAHRRSSNLETSGLPDGSEIRILTKPVFDRQTLIYVIQAGSSSLETEASLQNALLLNAIFIPAAILLVSAGGWWLTRRALAPLRTVMQTAHRISEGELSQRIEEATGYGVEIRELAHAFNQMTERLEASFRQISDFTDNVSHELRIPLSILRGQTEVSLRRARSEEEYRRVLLSNLEEIQRMEKIVERLLFLSRADRGEITINRAPVDLRGLVSNVAAQFAATAQQKGIRLAVEAPPPAPPADLLTVPEEMVMAGDELFLRELLFNLVQNAVTATPAGGAITLGLARQNEWFELTVADTGSGIPADDIPHIFERFYKVDRSRASQGSGLGLSLCKWIANAHGGRILVESTVGLGSRFTVLLPVPH
ncbi:MAG TPA: ATP-binding protein [Nitrospiria bacterium]|nr:ATP-binding protein [Nitrospiria bacterium]